MLISIYMYMYTPSFPFHTFMILQTDLRASTNFLILELLNINTKMFYAVVFFFFEVEVSRQ